MANQVDRRSMARWLLAHDFTELASGMTSHRRYRHRSGVTITLPGHGPADLTKKHVGMIVRELERAGFDRDAVRQDLG